jgi:hypothetical protein
MFLTLSFFVSDAKKYVTAFVPLEPLQPNCIDLENKKGLQERLSLQCNTYNLTGTNSLDYFSAAAKMKKIDFNTFL